jgi:hypothetical protein
MAKSGGDGSAPKGGKQPQQKAAGKPAAKAGKIAKGAPTRGSGSDLNPYSSARKGGR